MIFRIVCSNCTISAKLSVEYCPPWLSPIALAMNRATRAGFCYRNGRIGKSVVTMLCKDCRPKILRLEADFLPSEIPPGTWETDLE